jgi:hypothetical protein
MTRLNSGIEGGVEFADSLEASGRIGAQRRLDGTHERRRQIRSRITELRADTARVRLANLAECASRDGESSGHDEVQQHAE